MKWRFLRSLMEPAKDPLRDSFGISIERVRTLRMRLDRQIAELRARGARLEGSSFENQLRQLEAEHARLVEVEKRVAVELDTHRAQRDLVEARETAAQAQERLGELVEALDDAHARAAALAEAVWER